MFKNDDVSVFAEFKAYDAVNANIANEAVPTFIDAVCAICTKLAVSTFDAFCANNAYDAVIANEAVPTVIDDV